MRNLFMIILALSLVSCGTEYVGRPGGEYDTTVTDTTSETIDSGSSSETDTGTIYEKTNWSCIICQ